MATRYKQIRIVNNFLQHITVTSVLSDDEKNLLSAEARFIRAMQYFGLVKRYGGVPLQTVPMEYSSDPTSLYQARDTEQSVYDFIIDECKKIYMDLPEVRSSDSKYQASRGAALALWSRAALYAGSIAKYSGVLTLTGEAVSKGYVRISESEAERYFTECYTASSIILNDMVPQVYSLYKTSSSDTDALAQNFYNLFSKAINGEKR